VRQARTGGFISSVTIPESPGARVIEPLQNRVGARRRAARLMSVVAAPAMTICARSVRESVGSMTRNGSCTSSSCARRIALESVSHRGISNRR
jgi:hypothetical protein